MRYIYFIFFLPFIFCLLLSFFSFPSAFLFFYSLYVFFFYLEGKGLVFLIFSRYTTALKILCTPWYVSMGRGGIDVLVYIFNGGSFSCNSWWVWILHMIVWVLICLAVLSMCTSSVNGWASPEKWMTKSWLWSKSCYYPLYLNKVFIKTDQNVLNILLMLNF